MLLLSEQTIPPCSLQAIQYRKRFALSSQASPSAIQATSSCLLVSYTKEKERKNGPIFYTSSPVIRLHHKSSPGCWCCPAGLIAAGISIAFAIKALLAGRYRKQNKRSPPRAIREGYMGHLYSLHSNSMCTAAAIDEFDSPVDRPDYQ